jgi:hypothetical protein
MNTKFFSCWAHWNNRGKLEGLTFPGVYALAISKADLSGKRFSWIKEIVYVGMSNSLSGLKGRLKQFDNTILGKTGHGGADRFRYDYPNREELEPFLYVAIAHFECDVSSTVPADLLVMGNVAKAEYECWATFVEAHKRLPKYNDKKNAPKFSKTPTSG